MAMIHCIGCGQGISDKSEFCPNCGTKKQNIKAKPDLRDWLSITALGLATAAFILSFNMNARIAISEDTPDTNEENLLNCENEITTDSKDFTESSELLNKDYEFATDSTEPLNLLSKDLYPIESN